MQSACRQVLADMCHPSCSCRNLNRKLHLRVFCLLTWITSSIPSSDNIHVPYHRLLAAVGVAKVLHTAEKEELQAANCKLQEQAAEAAELARVHAQTLEAELQQQRQVRLRGCCTS